MNVSASHFNVFRQTNSHVQKRTSENNEEFRKQLRELHQTQTDQESLQSSYDYAIRIANNSLQYANGIRTARTESKNTANELKKLKYNFKGISAQILRSKTSVAARQVVTKARAEVARLKRMRKSGVYDDGELEAAIAHAQAMERVAKKKVKHLQEEEMIHVTDEQGLSGKVEPIDTEEEIEEVQDEVSEEVSEELGEEMIQEMEEFSELQQMMAEAMDEMLAALDMTDMMESVFDVSDFEMTEDDFKMLKIKHRTKEMKEIVEADTQYLKAMFEKYQADMHSTPAVTTSVPSGGGSPPPVMTSPEMAILSSGGIDICV